MKQTTDEDDVQDDLTITRDSPVMIYRETTAGDLGHDAAQRQPMEMIGRVRTKTLYTSLSPPSRKKFMH